MASPAPVREPASPAEVVLMATLHLAGWEVRSIDLDLVAGRATARLFRYDGRWLYASADDLGRASIERWHRTAVVKRSYGAPNGAQFDSFDDQFLGRSQCEGARSMLRAVCSYIADNPAPGFRGLLAADVRRAFAPLMIGGS